MDLDKLEKILNAEYMKKNKGFVEYGTAGFRTKADVLPHILYRMGLLAVLRSKVKKATIGLMITASHNMESDNGVKLVDPAGEMLESSWEQIATDLANTEDSNLINTLKEIIREKNIDMLVDASVIIGRDTRKSGTALLNAAVSGIKCLNGTVKDFGMVTTPQLHYLVVCTNTQGKYGKPTLNGYYCKLSEAFNRLRKNSVKNGSYSEELSLDAANGVGGIAAKEFQNFLGSSLKINLHNDGQGELNYMCGADYVKVQQAPPIDFPIKANLRCVSIDGDADRVVYFYQDENEKFHLLDGDRIATLIAVHLKELLQESRLSFTLGLVQTAYANGASTNYILNVLKVPVAFASTGIKHLHKKALEFDIGIYFEANGHGTVLFQDIVRQTINEATVNEQLSTTERSAASRLKDIISLINETVGDAFSDMLLVETILQSKGWSIIEWEKMYADLPNKQLKVKVADKNVIKTVNAGRKCSSPEGLQREIDKIVAKYRKGRSFVRPSGTEDIVRVYAECEEGSELNKMTLEIAVLVHKFAGGVGPEPFI